jgi:hypothetical protein
MATLRGTGEKVKEAVDGEAFLHTASAGLRTPTLAVGVMLGCDNLKRLKSLRVYEHVL